jgi:hypothetical protein
MNETHIDPAANGGDETVIMLVNYTQVKPGVYKGTWGGYEAYIPELALRIIMPYGVRTPWLRITLEVTEERMYVRVRNE